MKVLVTGAAGFIGLFTCMKLLARGDSVIGVDNLNDYYDVRLKVSRIQQLASYPEFRLEQLDITDAERLSALISRERPERIVHLAAQAGVRYSLQNPHAYVDANITGFLNLLEAIRRHGCEHLVYASTSSVYGSNARLSLATEHNVDHPVSLYAATKKANELMAHAYSHLFALPCTGLRFFTVYGPWGRPDMAFFTFTRKMLAGEPIDIYNHGQLSRDFTYVEDIAEGVVRVLDHPARPDPQFDRANPSPAKSNVPWRIYNIGSNRRVPLLQYISVLEQALGVEAIRNNMPMQSGDVEDTFADVSDLVEDVDFQPVTPIEIGIPRFVGWYLDYYHPDARRRPQPPEVAS